jgi:hypothetical protein
VANGADGGPALVTETGIALVEAGELVVPAAGDAAQAERVVDDGRMSIQYYFPVEIEVRAAPEPVPAQEIVDLALDALASGLRDV